MKVDKPQPILPEQRNQIARERYHATNGETLTALREFQQDVGPRKRRRGGFVNKTSDPGYLEEKKAYDAWHQRLVKEPKLKMGKEEASPAVIADFVEEALDQLQEQRPWIAADGTFIKPPPRIKPGSGRKPAKRPLKDTDEATPTKRSKSS